MNNKKINDMFKYFDLDCFGSHVLITFWDFYKIRSYIMYHILGKKEFIKNIDYSKNFNIYDNEFVRLLKIKFKYR